MAFELNPYPALPHRAPFLMLDRVIEIDAERGRFAKMVAASDPCVTAAGILPAVFVLEAMAQAGGALIAATSAPDRPAGMLAKVDGFRTHAAVRVGDELRVEVRLVRHARGVSVFDARATVDEALRAEARVTLALPA